MLDLIRTVKRIGRMLGGADKRSSNIDRWSLWVHNVNAIHGNLKDQIGPVKETSVGVYVTYSGKEYLIHNHDNESWLLQDPESDYISNMFPVMVGLDNHTNLIRCVYRAINLATKGIPVYTSKTTGGQLMDIIYTTQHYAVHGRLGNCRSMDQMKPDEPVLTKKGTPRVSRIPDSDLGLSNSLNPLSPFYFGNVNNPIAASSKSDDSSDTRSHSDHSSSSSYSSSSDSSSSSSSYD